MSQYQTLPAETRVWIYQSNRPLTSDEVEKARTDIQSFATQWISHNQQLTAHADVLHERFVVLMVDETRVGVGGCSIDSSIHFIQNLQRELGVDFFDRMMFAWKEGDQVKTAPRDEFANLYSQGLINDDTLVFDNLVNTKAKFESQWLKPLKDSWHTRMV